MGGPEIVTFEEIVRRLEKTKKMHIHIPVFIMNAFASIAEKLKIPFPITVDQLKMLGKDNVTSDKSIYEIVGFTPRKSI